MAALASLNSPLAPAVNAPAVAVTDALAAVIKLSNDGTAASATDFAAFAACVAASITLPGN